MKIRPAAERDLADARDWSEAQKPGPGDELIERVGDVLSRIESFPESHAPGYKGFRRALVSRFPYAVFYKIEAKGVVVHGLIHTSRDPRDWQSRK